MLLQINKFKKKKKKKTDCDVERSILALLLAYQEYLVTFYIDDVTSGTKSTTTQDVYICPWGSKG